jgi:hypothetical protein
VVASRWVRILGDAYLCKVISAVHPAVSLSPRSPHGHSSRYEFLGVVEVLKYPREKGKPIDLPVYGDAELNMRIYQAIGGLVINWGSDESVFLAMLQALLTGEKFSAIIVWLSFHNSANRLELVRRLTKQQVTDEALRDEIESAITEFEGCTKTRNFFCHAAYGQDDEGRLAIAHNMRLSDDTPPWVRDTSRPLDRANLQNVVETARRLADLNPVLWALVGRLEDALQIPSAKRQRVHRAAP